MRKFLSLVAIVSSTYSLEAMPCTPEGSGENVMSQVLKRISQIEDQNKELNDKLKEIQEKAITFPNYSLSQELSPVKTEGLSTVFEIPSDGLAFAGANSEGNSVSILIDGVLTAEFWTGFSFLQVPLAVKKGGKVTISHKSPAVHGNQHKLRFVPCEPWTERNTEEHGE